MEQRAAEIAEEGVALKCLNVDTTAEGESREMCRCSEIVDFTSSCLHSVWSLNPCGKNIEQFAPGRCHAETQNRSFPDL